MVDGSKKTLGLRVEFVFLALMIFALYRMATFFYAAGYLPPPFFDESSDTFMDWYNTTYWAYRPGTYSEWFSIYPPLSIAFLKVFSIARCYENSGLEARDCDPIGAWVLTGFTLLNLLLVFAEYFKSDRKSALPRAVAAGLGMPALFAWERGNLIVPCFTFFILAHGRLLKSTWLRWIFFAMSVNFKPYLVITVIGRLIRGKWRWAEGCAVATVLVYVASYILMGKGSPLELISDVSYFSHFTGNPDVIALDFVEYATTYVDLLLAVKSQLPLMHFIGSLPLEVLEKTLPIVMKLGSLGALLALAGAVWRPLAISAHRLAALILCVLLTLSPSAGGYAEVFLIFLVLFERWNSVGAAIALVSAYLLAVPWDVQIVKIIYRVTFSYLSGRVVGSDYGVTLGALVRPGFLLLLQYGLVLASLTDIFRNAGGAQGAVHPARINTPARALGTAGE